MAISNERIRLSEFLAQGNPEAIADFISKSPKIQKALVDFSDSLDVGLLVEALRGKPREIDDARDFLDEFLEVKAGKLPIGRLPAKVRWLASRDDGYESAAKAKSNFEKAFKAASKVNGLPKAFFHASALMYHASAASLSFLNLTKRERRIGMVLGAELAAAAAFTVNTEAAIDPNTIDAINNTPQFSIQEPLTIKPKALSKDAFKAASADEEALKLSINSDVSILYTSEHELSRAQQYIKGDKYKTYMGAKVSEEMRKAFVMADAITPYPYEFWQGQAYAESTFNKDAINTATMARGIMQMTPDTTLEILYDMKDKPQYSFIPEAQLVVKTFDKSWVAHYDVKEGIDKDALIESVAYEPLKAVMIAAELNTKYFALLQDKYPDREMNSVDAYVLHWQGYKGSQKIFEAGSDDLAVEVYGEKSGVVQNHLSIFYVNPVDTDSKRSVAEMLSHLRDVRGLGNIPIPKIADWKATEIKIDYKPQDVTPAEIKYAESMELTSSKKPKPRPERKAQSANIGEQDSDPNKIPNVRPKLRPQKPAQG